MKNNDIMKKSIIPLQLISLIIITASSQLIICMEAPVQAALEHQRRGASPAQPDVISEPAAAPSPAEEDPEVAAERAKKAAFKARLNGMMGGNPNSAPSSGPAESSGRVPGKGPAKGREQESPRRQGNKSPVRRAVELQLKQSKDQMPPAPLDTGSRLQKADTGEHEKGAVQTAVAGSENPAATANQARLGGQVNSAEQEKPKKMSPRQRFGALPPLPPVVTLKPIPVASRSAVEAPASEVGEQANLLAGSINSQTIATQPVAVNGIAGSNGVGAVAGANNVQLGAVSDLEKARAWARSESGRTAAKACAFAAVVAGLVWLLYDSEKAQASNSPA